MGKPPVDRRLDEARREEGKRQGYVHLPHSAAFAGRDAVEVSRCTTILSN
jgi:hypothetical protein